MLFSRIVIGTDFSEPSIRAARWMGEFIAPHAELHLVHIVEPPDEPRTVVPAPWAADQLRAASDVAEQRLAETAAHIGRPATVTAVRVGRSWEALNEYAAEVDADLIVVGPHGARERRWMPLGNTAERLVRTANRAVLIATHPRQAPPRRMLVGLDDADVLGAVLDSTAAWSNTFGASVHAIHVFSVAVMSHILSTAQIGAVSPETAQERVAESIRRETVRWNDLLTSNGVAPSRLFVEVTDGHAGDRLLERAEALDADLVMLGREGSGAVRSMLLGSCVNAVIHGARCPVLVVTAPSSRDDSA